VEPPLCGIQTARRRLSPNPRTACRASHGRVFLKDVYWLPEGVLGVAVVVIGLVALAVNAWRGRAFVAALMAIFRRRR
jgi:hypothetical protein